MRFQIGDIVKIKKSSSYYDNRALHNPKDTKGRIIDFSDSRNDLDIKVKWDNDATAYYNEGDLGLVRRNRFVNEPIPDFEISRDDIPF